MIFSEYRGRLQPGAGMVAPPGGRVVLSALSWGSAESPAQPTLGIKYVATGTEIYSYGDRSYALGAGHMLLVPPGWSGDASIGRSDAAVTRGLCIYLPRPDQAVCIDAPTRPVIVPADCSSVGRLIARCHRLLSGPVSDRDRAAARLAAAVQARSEPLLEETSRHLDKVGSMKQATRYDLLSRLNKARAYLHGVTDRPVPLAELAAVANISSFHLLRHFRASFGDPPAAYHRKIRLDMARRAIAEGRLSCAQAATCYGFANPSSFSHAFVRVYGHPPGAAACQSVPKG